MDCWTRSKKAGLRSADIFYTDQAFERLGRGCAQHVMGLFKLNQQEHVWEERARSAQVSAAQALARLLSIAEFSDSGQARCVATFLASSYKYAGAPFDLFDLRTVDVPISDDMMLCIDALRWGKLDLHNLVPNGAQRIEGVMRDWGLR